MPDTEDVLRDIDQNFAVAVNKLLELIAIPSISSEASAKSDIARAAEWLKAELDALIESRAGGGHL